jgi:uncharacterized repeat protein (TIGR01451 family)
MGSRGGILAKAKLFVRGVVLLSIMVSIGAWVALAQTITTHSGNTFSISMTDDLDPVGPGGTVTYVITVENTSLTEQSFVDFEDTVAGNGTIDSVTSSQGSCGVISAVFVTCALGTISAGASATITVNKVADTGKVGGISALPDLRALPLETTASSGLSAGLLAAIASAAAAGAAALGVGAWYVRRKAPTSR